MIFVHKLRTNSPDIVNLVTSIPHLLLFCISEIMTALLPRALHPRESTFVDTQKSIYVRLLVSGILKQLYSKTIVLRLLRFFYKRATTQRILAAKRNCRERIRIFQRISRQRWKKERKKRGDTQRKSRIAATR